ncbi:MULTISPECIES: mycofactocin precursor MftA [Actinomadura]|nr:MULTISPECIES: mycofactocin precursor MftA [Actinomadura]RSN69269.1 mycofactocin precursor [Actinomadura sp. WAC 06369]
MDSAATENQSADERTEDAAAAESLIEEVSIDGMCGVY